jgi:hypothetical protein
MGAPHLAGQRRQQEGADPAHDRSGHRLPLALERAAGMDPLRGRATCGHDLGLLGGIDKRALARGRKAIEAVRATWLEQVLHLTIKAEDLTQLPRGAEVG